MKNSGLRRARSIAKKEVFHILRDPFTLALALGLPVFLVVVFGFTVDFNVKDIPISISDGDKSASSRLLLEKFQSSKHFRIVYRNTITEVVSDLDSDRAKTGLIIEPGFEKDLQAGRPIKTQVIQDGSDNSTAGVIIGYLNGVEKAYLSAAGTDARAPNPMLEARFMYNPELTSSWFVVPGLSVVVIAILSILLTTLTVAREWENGSMELLLSTPVKPIEIIIGKIAPYTILGIIAVIFIYLAARLVFDVPFNGSHLLFGFATLLFITAYLAQGVLISVVTRKQQLAMQLGMISGLLPSLLLSGFIFPIESMPVFFQYLTSILPAKWYMMISRHLFLKDAGYMELLKPFGALLLLTFVLVTVSRKRFKKDLEP